MMKGIHRLDMILVTSILILSLIHYLYHANHLKGASVHPLYRDILTQDSSNIRNNHNSSNNDSNNNNNINNTKPNEMSIQICDKSHPCKTAFPKGNLQ